MKFLLFFLLLFVSFLAPSSFGGAFAGFGFFHFIINSILCFFYLFSFSKLNTNKVSMLVLVFVLFVFFTLISSFTEYAWGRLYSLIPMFLFFGLDFNQESFLKKYKGLYFLFFYSSVLFLLLVAYFSISDGFLNLFLVDFYSNSYEGLVDRMLLLDKMVGIFSTHSLAAFFYSLIILALLSAAIKSNNLWFKLLNFAIALLFALALLSLRSNTSLAMLIVGSGVVIYSGLKDKFKNGVIILTLFGIFSLIVLIYMYIYNYQSLVKYVLALFGDEKNGLSARYLGGVLSANMEQISSNPLLGVGLSYSPDFYYTDSSYVLYLLQVGVIGCVVVHYLAGKVFSSLTQGVFPRFYLLAFLVTSLGYPVIEYFRFIPFLIIILCFFRYLDD